MANGTADATLVAAAYKMGMANVPADTSRTFMRQYEALGQIDTAKIELEKNIVSSAVTLGKLGIGFALDAATKKRQDKRDEEFNDEESGIDNVDNLVKDHVGSMGKNWSNYKTKADPTTIDYQKKKIEVIKEEITRLRKAAKGNPENIAKISELEKKVSLWRDETNQGLSDINVHSEYFKTDAVDNNTSFRTTTSSGDTEFSPTMALLYKDVMDPSVDLNDANITPFAQNGQEGYLFNPKEDRLALSYNLSKKSMLGYDPKAKTTGFFEKKYSNEGAGFGGKNIQLAKKKNTSWISREELLSFVKLKDKDLPIALTGKMTDILKGGLNKVKQRILNADGSVEDHKTKKNYLISDYSEIAKKSENDFYNIIMSPTSTQNKKSVTRDVKGGIAYISNNEIMLGNTPINYGEMKRKDFSVDIAVINQMGVGSNVFTAKELKDGKIDAAELAKHEGAKEKIYKILFNPKTKQETEIAAREIAKFFNLQTMGKFNSDRGNVVKTKPIVKTPTSDFKETPDTKDITFYMDMVNDVKEKPVKGYDYDGDGLVDDAPIKK